MMVFLFKVKEMVLVAWNILKILCTLDNGKMDLKMEMVKLKLEIEKFQDFLKMMNYHF